MPRDANVQQDDRREPVALPFRPDGGTVWAYPARPGVMRVRNRAGEAFEIPRPLFEKIYKRV